MRGKGNVFATIAITLLVAITFKGAKTAQADAIDLNYVSVATGVDYGQQDGVFDIFPPYNLGSVANNDWTSHRTAFEFYLLDLPPHATINSANLTISIYNQEGTRAVQVHGYAGGGAVQLSDLALDNLVAGASIETTGSQTFTFDVTDFVADLAANGQIFAGFNVREEPPNVSNFVLMNLNLGHLPILSIVFSVEPVAQIAVTGRVVGPDGPTMVALQRESDWGFEEVNWRYLFPWDEEFFFDTDWYGNPLSPGSYRVTVSAFGYSEELFSQYLADGQEWDLGTIALAALPQANIIRGRVVDRWTGEPLPGDSLYVWVTLWRVSEWGGGEWVGGRATSATGRFRFTPENTGGLFAGTYYLEVSAEGYEPYRSVDFPVSGGADVILGDLAVTPFPIQIRDPASCDPIPAGGVCSYTFEVFNRTDARFQGAAWSLVDAWGTGSPLGSTRFQSGSKGAQKAVKKLSLKPGEVATLTFEFAVPAGLADWAGICVGALVGEDPDVFFQTVAERHLFCATKTPSGLELMSEEQVRKLKRGKGAPPVGALNSR